MWKKTDSGNSLDWPECAKADLDEPEWSLPRGLIKRVRAYLSDMIKNCIEAEK